MIRLFWDLPGNILAGKHHESHVMLALDHLIRRLTDTEAELPLRLKVLGPRRSKTLQHFLQVFLVIATHGCQWVVASIQEHQFNSVLSVTAMVLITFMHKGHCADELHINRNQWSGVLEARIGTELIMAL